MLITKRKHNEIIEDFKRQIRELKEELKIANEEVEIHKKGIEDNAKHHHNEKTMLQRQLNNANSQINRTGRFGNR
jgi:chromosome segregation ATPase